MEKLAQKIIHSKKFSFSDSFKNITKVGVLFDASASEQLLSE
jgi:hypothetical protein